MKSLSQCSLRKTFAVYHIQERKQFVKVDLLSHISEYILGRNCFHMIFWGKDLPTVASMKSISQYSLRKTFAVNHIQD